MKKAVIIIGIIVAGGVITYLIMENEYHKETARQLEAIEQEGRDSQRIYDTQIRLEKIMNKYK